MGSVLWAPTLCMNPKGKYGFQIEVHLKGAWNGLWSGLCSSKCVPEHAILSDLAGVREIMKV